MRDRLTDSGETALSRRATTRSIVTMVMADPRSTDTGGEPPDGETAHEALGKQLEIPDLEGYGHVTVDIDDICESSGGDAFASVTTLRHPVPHIEEREFYGISTGSLSYLASDYNAEDGTVTEKAMLGSRDPADLRQIQQKLEKFIVAVELSR